MTSDWFEQIGSYYGEGADDRSPAGGTGTGFSRPAGKANSASPSSVSLPWAKEHEAFGSFLNWAEERFTDIPFGKVKFFLIELIGGSLRKENAPLSSEFFRHYFEGNGKSYELKKIPLNWQRWIVNKTKGIPGNHLMDPYNDPSMYDLTHALGHFEVFVSGSGKVKTYTIKDFYHFGFSKDKNGDINRHGFELAPMSEVELNSLRNVLPPKKYRYGNGFSDQWEVVRLGEKPTILIPYGFLHENGTPYKIYGSFTQ